MVFKSTLLLLTSMVLASSLPSEFSRPEAHLARRSDKFAIPWGGVSLSGKAAGTFDTIQGTFTVPELPRIDRDSQVLISLGIDTIHCPGGGCLQVGILTYVTPILGERKYNGWCAWGNVLHSFDDSQMTISAGDVINATVIAYSATSGEAYLDNFTTGHYIRHIYTSQQPALSQQEASWVVEASDKYPLGDFGTVTFSSAIAVNNHTGIHYDPSSPGAKLLDVEAEDGKKYTSVIIGPDHLTVSYV